MIRLKPGAWTGRDALLHTMAERGISCRVGIQPLHQEPFYEGRYAGVRFPITEEAARATMFLPIFPGLTEEEQGRIIAALAHALSGG